MDLDYQIFKKPSEKYGGQCRTQTDGRTFMLKILIPLPDS